MAIETRVIWNGDREKRQMGDAVVRALIRATNKVQADAKLLVPVDTGNLRGSIVTAVDNNKQIGTVTTNSKYAFYIEFGTGRLKEGGGGRATPWRFFSTRYGWVTTTGSKPYPFMRPALNNNKDKIKKMFIQEGRRAVDS